MWIKVIDTPMPPTGKHWVRVVSKGWGEKERVEYHSCEMHEGKPFVIGHHFAFDCGVITHWQGIERIDS